MENLNQYSKALREREFSKLKVGQDRGVPADIYYKTYGPETAEKIVFVMGFLARGDIWDEQIAFFSKEYHVLVLDNRGSGESSVTPGRYTTTMLAQDAYQLIEHLGWTKYHIVGCSMGGMISQELALLRINQVQSLTLIATQTGEGWKSIPPMLGLYIQVKNMFVSDPNDKQHNAMRILYGPKVLENKELYDKLHYKGVSGALKYGYAPFESFKNQVAAVFTHKVEKPRLELLKRAKVPTLVITGTHDNLIRSSNSIEIAQTLDVKPVILQDYGHHLCWECPEELNRLIQQHLN